MAATAILIFCAQALLIQSVFSQCINRGPIPSASIGPIGVNRGWGYDGLAYDGWNRGLGYPGAVEFTPTSGGGFAVISASSLAPTGLSIFSENAYEGPISVLGKLPFLGTVALEGTLPTMGAGAISYGCGNGVTAMISEGFGSELGLAPGLPGAMPGFTNGRLGYDGCGCGYGLMY